MGLHKTIWLAATILALSGCKAKEWLGLPLLPDARVTAYSPEGVIRYEREWRGGKKHGLWREYENGQLKSETHWNRGEKLP